MNKKLINIKSAFLIIILSAGIFAFTDPGERYFAIAKNLDIFATLFKEVNAMYVDEVNPNQLMQTGIEAMLMSLDPYTNYIPEDDIEDFRTRSTGQYGGIGAITTRMDGKIMVSMIFNGYSAEKNGLKIGDQVIKINNIDITEMDSESTSELMKGQAGTPVSLTVLRYGKDEPITLNFTREKVKIDNVPYSGMVADGIGYLKLTEFTMRAGEEVKNAVEALKANGAEKIILDLRNNPGGLLHEAVNICNVFIPKNKEVVSTRGKIEEHNNVYKTEYRPVDTEIPLVVLINSGSASASEIVAGTIQDYDRGVIIGQKSFGKGLVQITRPLSYNAQLKVTTAKYYTPSGRCIQALDYSNRNEDGSVGKVPDSLKNEFRTTNNRIVYDGGGIDPDVEISGEKLSPIAFTLIRDGHIFDYATKYFYEHPEITDAKDFALSTEEYADFKKWLKEREYNYTTDVEKNLSSLSASAKKEQYYQDILPQLEKLKETLQNSKQNDLEDFRDQIITLLEEEIASRYFFQKGSVEASFDEDQVIKKSIEILNNPKEYQRILH
ncbi:MAG: S41 family peptidase [Fulvivirga sp.]|nr:S41 family peptidase [Fulvivirga sp.]